MTINQLIKKLQQYDPNLDVMINDSNNNGNYPRTINFGPVLRKIQEFQVEQVADCEGKLGEKVIIIGFGCY